MFFKFHGANAKGTTDQVRELLNRNRECTQVDSSAQLTRSCSHLPPSFPNVCPRLTMSRGFVHQWVDPRGNVASPALHNWSVHSDLGLVVFNIARELRRGNMTSGTGYANPGGVPASGAGTGSSFHPSVPTSFPELEKLSVGELDEMLGSDAKYNAFLHDLPFIKNQEQVKRDLQTSNEAMEASKEENASGHGEVEGEVKGLKDSLGRLKLDVEQLEKRQRGVLSALTNEAVLEKLTEAIEGDDNAAEELASEFLDGTVEFKDFMTKYLELRRQYYARKVKSQMVGQGLAGPNV